MTHVPAHTEALVALGVTNEQFDADPQAYGASVLDPVVAAILDQLLGGEGTQIRETDVPGIFREGDLLFRRLIDGTRQTVGRHEFEEERDRVLSEDLARQAGFRAGAQPQITQRVDANGDLVTFRDGFEASRLPGFGVQTLSPEEEQRLREQELEAARVFTTEERVAGQEFERQEDETQRQFIARQEAAARAQQSSQFATQVMQENARREFEAAQFNAQQQRLFQQQQFDAARQFADLISLTDPAALPAFAAAGGGNISNALAQGATALSENALLPAARTLQGIRQSVAPSPFQFSPIQAPQFDPNQFFDMLFPAVPPAAATSPEPLGTRQSVDTSALESQLAGRGATTSDLPGFVQRNLGLPVIPAQEGLSGIVDQPTLILAGENGPENINVTPQDQPFLDEVRDIRTGVDTGFPLGINPFDVQFNFLLPGLRERFFRARQSRFGLPLRDQLFEQQRFALPGIGRGSLRLGA